MNNEKTMNESQEIIDKLKQNITNIIKGKNDVIELVITALISDGHILLEDFPGCGKTTLAKTIGNSISHDEDEQLTFNRIQFTPDLLPSDIIV